jgi:hypothetical protein
MIIHILFLVTQNMVLDLVVIAILLFMIAQILIINKIFQDYVKAMEKMKVPKKEI